MADAAANGFVANAMDFVADEIEGFFDMNQLLKPEGGSSFVCSSGALAFLARPSVAIWAPVPLRVIVGFGFMAHGFAKLSKGPETFAAILHAIGVPAPHLMAWLTILIELIGDLAVLLGAFVHS